MSCMPCSTSCIFVPDMLVLAQERFGAPHESTSCHGAWFVCQCPEAQSPMNMLALQVKLNIALMQLPGSLEAGDGTVSIV